VERRSIARLATAAVAVAAIALGAGSAQAASLPDVRALALDDDPVLGQPPGAASSARTAR
jgi:hypothetical protein